MFLSVDIFFGGRMDGKVAVSFIQVLKYLTENLL